MKAFDHENEMYHMGHFILDNLRSRPDGICQIDAATGESETNASVLRRSVQFAQCLRRFGIRPGDVLALGGNNHLDLPIPFFAAHFNGMPVAGVDPLFKYIEIKAHYKVSSPKVVFCQKEHLEENLRAIEELEMDTKVICFDDGEYSMKKFIAEYSDINEDEDFAPLDFDLNKIYAWLVSTGGTTGVLKLAAFKHRTIISRILEFGKIFGKRDTNGPRNDNIPSLHLSPVQWISSFFNCVCFPIMRQTKIMTSAPLTIEHLIDIINKYKPDNVMIAPALVTAIMRNEKQCDLTSFTSIVLSGSKIHKDVLLELKKRMRPGAALIEAYGQTESLGPILIPNPAGPIGNCGVCPPSRSQDIKLVNPETGKEITEPNVQGELWHKWESISEYYNNPEETANVFTHDGWYKTGDILYKDQQGNFYFVERLNMLIKCRGYHVIAPELEAVIREHPDVGDVSVTSIPHEEDGERPVACVVRRKGRNVSAQEIKDIVANKLSESQSLRGGVVFMDELPLTSTGKVARAKLRQMVLTAHRE